MARPAALYACEVTVSFSSPALGGASSSSSARMLMTSLTLLIGLVLASALTTPTRPGIRGHGLGARAGVLVALLLVYALMGLGLKLAGNRSVRAGTRRCSTSWGFP